MEMEKILVVDDEAEICQITKKFLDKKNFNTFTALNSEEALKVITKEKPRIVFLDIRLGGESGLDALSRIKQIDKNIKVIMVTAVDDAETIRQAKALGADDYVTKPFTTSYLNDFILQKISSLKLKDAKGK